MAKTLNYDITNKNHIYIQFIGTVHTSQDKCYSALEPTFDERFLGITLFNDVK